MNEERKMIIAADSGIVIKSLESIPDAIGKCYGADGLLLTEKELSAEFFNLRTGVAGELFQKATNYHLRLAIVLRDPSAYGERFSELIYEHKNHPIIRFFHAEAEARTWLSKLTSK
jgi:Domain of unknown function (DUF4180)